MGRKRCLVPQGRLNPFPAVSAVPAGLGESVDVFPGQSGVLGYTQPYLSKLAHFLLRFTVKDNCVGCHFSAEEWCAASSWSRPGGPPAKRKPSPEGLGHRWTMILSAVGAALFRSATQPDFATSGRSTSLSNEINATESTNQLIWTALTLNRPFGTEFGILGSHAHSLAGFLQTGANQSA